MFGFRAIYINKVVAAVQAAIDYTGYLVLSLKGESSFNGNSITTILDRSPNAAVVTRAGDAAQRVSSFSPFSSGWSYSFDGTGDYLTAPANTALQLGAGDYTVEAWINPTTVTGTFASMIVGTYAFDGGDFGWGLALNPTGKLQFWSYGTTSGVGMSIIETGTRVVGQWCHVAVSRSGTTVKLWIDGVEAASTTSSKNENYSRILKIGTQEAVNLSPTLGNSQTTFKGYISNVRIVKGTAVYTAAFTPSITPLTAIANTSLLTCHAGRLFDGSSNDANITVAGNVTASTFSRFNKTELSGTVENTSVYFDGTGDYLTAPSAAAFGFGTGDFTVEFWLNLNSTAAARTLYSHLTSASSVNPHLYCAAGGSVRYYTNNADRITGATLVTGRWYHIAVCRSSGSTQLFIDGVQSGSTYSDSNNYGSTAPLGIGTYWSGGAPVTTDTANGYISNLRVVKGTAVYTAAFTPSTSALTAVSGTSLLACNGAAITDSSSNNATITVGGDARISSLNPFSSVGGWSGYFDGTGDYLSISRNSAFFPVANTDFTIEAWVYLTATPGATNAQIIGAGEYGTDADWVLNINSSLTVGMYIQSSNITYTGGTVTLNTWTHIAVSRSGTSSNNLKVFVNGVGTSYSLNNTLVGVGNRALTIGADQNGDESNLTGYISNVRIVNGTAVYTGNFTPPSSALTAVSGTSLLTLQDNTFKDNSSNAFAITVTGDAATIGTGPFEDTGAALFPGSVYFDGTNDYLTIPASTNTQLLGGDFTIECWYYPVSFDASGYNYLINQNAGISEPSGNFDIRISAAGALQFYSFTNSTTGSLWTFSSTNTVKLGTWNHVAVSHVRSSNTTRLFVNGSLGGTSTNATWAGRTVQTCLGAPSAGALQSSTYARLNGHMAGVRLIKGRALYTASFTVPSSPPKAVAGTAMLLNFNDGGIVDAYGSSSAYFNANTGVVSNSVSKKYGVGSMYFPATYMTAPANPDYAFGTGDFTIEMWLNSTNGSNSSRGIISITATAAAGVASGSNAGVGIRFASSQFNGLINFHIGGSALTGTINATNGTFTHVALCRSGSTVRLFVGGVLSVKTTSSSNLTGQFLTLGATHFGGLNSPMTGYIDNLAIYKGYAKYTSDTTFTPV
jgi:hypothetical protein